ncbi:DUF5602 domain-containing protein [Microvirga massiliensis]|uniref:DUF5602 domain-containing protein n=1 Tax=Microvirga massiliensis TaxID=1033741 RepID=UPI00062BEDA5|nr:DUF5602 domain-containing protein [Microvirga massiliensis]
MKKQLIAAGVLATLITSAAEAQTPPRHPPRGFKKVSDLVTLPGFLPGLGVLYVRPETLPTGPFLAYDRHGRRVSTIYMIPVEDIANRKKFDLAGFAGRNDHVSMYFNGGHPGVEMPHYHVVIWHVNKRGEARVAK